MGISPNTEEYMTQVVECYSGMLLRIAYQNLLNRADAEDVVQDVFVRCMKKEHFNDEKHLTAWLIRVTINRCTDLKRSAWRRKTTVLSDDWPAATPEQDEVLLEVSKMAHKDRNVLYLYYYEGYKVREIAEILGEKENSVNSRLVRARKKLKNQLVEGGGKNV